MLGERVDREQRVVARARSQLSRSPSWCNPAHSLTSRSAPEGNRPSRSSSDSTTDLGDMAGIRSVEVRRWVARQYMVMTIP